MRGGPSESIQSRRIKSGLISPVECVLVESRESGLMARKLVLRKTQRVLSHYLVSLLKSTDENQRAPARCFLTVA
jgi:hypothetical protein